MTRSKDNNYTQRHDRHVARYVCTQYKQKGIRIQKDLLIYFFNLEMVKLKLVLALKSLELVQLIGVYQVMKYPMFKNLLVKILDQILPLVPSLTLLIPKPLKLCVILNNNLDLIALYHYPHHSTSLLTLFTLVQIF